MENKKLDQLFRERLAQHEIQPSRESWQLVNDQVQSKARPMVWMSIAASVVILMAAGFLLWNQQSEGVPGGHLASAPDRPDVDHVEWPELKFEQQKETTVVQPRVEKKRSNPEFKSNHVAEVIFEETQLEMPVALETIKPNLVEPTFITGELLPNHTLMTPEVEMTYLAGVEPEEDDKKGIEKIWAKAKDMSPGELWGSIRDTKNQLLSLNRN